MMETGRIYHGDCVETMKAWPDKSVALLLTDPPYGIGYAYNTYRDTRENLVELVGRFMPEALRVAHRVAVFSGVQNMPIYPDPDWVIAYTWNTTGSFGKLGYNQWQPVLFYGKDLPGFGSINGQLKADVVTFSGGNGVGFLRELDKEGHPCPKPLNVIKTLVARFSNEGEVCADPFMGSGTLALACEELGRRWLGCEIDAAYHALANRRVGEYRSQGKLF